VEQRLGTRYSLLVLLRRDIDNCSDLNLDILLQRQRNGFVESKVKLFYDSFFATSMREKHRDNQERRGAINNSG
jgi:hypothetical protein